MIGILQIITYLLCIYLVFKGFEILQIALMSSRSDRKAGLIIGIIAVIVSIFVAICFTILINEQAYRTAGGVTQPPQLQSFEVPQRHKPSLESLSKEEQAPTDNTPRKSSERGIVHVKYQSANLHSNPGLNEPVIEKVDRSTALKPILETEFWLQVQTPSGKHGWIAKDWVAENVAQEK